MLTEKEEEYVTLQLVIQSVVDKMTERPTMEDIMYRIFKKHSCICLEMVFKDF